MNQIRAVGFRRGEDAVDVEIALLRRARADADALVRKAHGKTALVVFRVDGDGTQSQFFTGANHANRDLAAVGH
ncbi:hypothetical protein SDC9_131020 [bioreactor metagenome]|uniref:Uncharacterized protein n=1 Tax=bioreactor metagenome TaxID=1076179 RepID=A0A645D386_9ZZZZ